MPELLEHLRVHGAGYDAVLFWAFRYAEVYFGLPHVADRAILVPTAEEDPVIRMSILERFFARPAGYIFLTPEEHELVQRRMTTGMPPSTIIGSGLDPAAARPPLDLRSFGVRDPFVLYLGRHRSEQGVRRPAAALHPLQVAEPRSGTARDGWTSQHAAARAPGHRLSRVRR